MEDAYTAVLGSGNFSLAYKEYPNSSEGLGDDPILSGGIFMDSALVNDSNTGPLLVYVKQHNWEEYVGINVLSTRSTSVGIDITPNGIRKHASANRSSTTAFTTDGKTFDLTTKADKTDLDSKLDVSASISNTDIDQIFTDLAKA